MILAVMRRDGGYELLICGSFYEVVRYCPFPNHLGKSRNVNSSDIFNVLMEIPSLTSCQLALLRSKVCIILLILLQSR